SFGVPLRPDVATRWKIGQHLGQRLAQLALQPPRLRPGGRLALFRSATLAFLRRGSDRRRGRRLLSRVDGGGVARDVTDDAILVRSLNQRLVNPVRQAAFRELGEGPRKRAFARNLACALPTAQPAQRGVDR